MNTVDLNLLPALDALLSEGSVVGAAESTGATLCCRRVAAPFHVAYQRRIC